MRIVRQEPTALEVFASGRAGLLLGFAVLALGIGVLVVGIRKGAFMLDLIGVVCIATGVGSLVIASDYHHVVDAGRGTLSVTRRRLLGGRQSVSTIYDLAQVADVDLEERIRRRRRSGGRAKPTYRLCWAFHDTRRVYWSDTSSSDRATLEECQQAARAVLTAWRTRHSR